MGFPNAQNNPAGAIPVYIAGGTGGGTPFAATPLGYEQISALKAVVTLTVPTGATFALIQAQTQNVRWTDDGSNPTASVGMLLATGAPSQFSSSLSVLKFIQTTASAVLNISYYA